MFGFAGIFIIIVVATVVVAVVYPDYSTLSYQLQDTCMSLSLVFLKLGWMSDNPLADEGTTFFDMFNYFTGYDPSSGFVQYVHSAWRWCLWDSKVVNLYTICLVTSISQAHCK